ncbi:alkyl sulfatase dimerization domain-containing protein [Hoeflea sp. TYP-13]|uniref:alkyl sulfatase dimerization domain-containing protein n=1 Tax=Hoeflea sp. TYP-13 TaxID=3230023 RepID=UPI0034C68AA2
MPNAALVEHNASQFTKSVVELDTGIWGAVGFAASNVYMVEGSASVTIIDTTESTKAAENILAEFRKLTDKPVGRIIYTHSHRDHISGAVVFASDRNIPVLASASFSSDLVGVDERVIAPNKALGRRTQAQFGIGLSPQERISLGCGPGDRPMEGMGAGHLAPTERISSDRDIDLDGVAARLIMAPGETADHMVVWLPAQKVLFSGDNWYHAFPNLYAIRGTPYRDFATWADSLALLAGLGAEVLAPGHTMPVRGAENVQEVLTTTRSAIMHVIRSTVDGMDRGLSLDDIAASIALPAELADKPWLREFYGKIEWSARAFAAGTLGWYGGNPTHLGTLSTRERAAHIARLAGGTAELLKAAETTGDLQWRLELCDHLIALGEPAQDLKATTMAELAEAEVNATARNTYLWEAKRLRGGAEGSG